MDEQDILLPEGWKEGDDLFADAAAGQDTGTAPEDGPGEASGTGEASEGGQASPETESVSGEDSSPGDGRPDDGPLRTASRTGALPPDAARALSRILGADPLPEEALRSEADGGGPLTAFAVWQARQAFRENERLRRENETLRQLRDAASRAPVRGVSGGGSARTAPRSDFERGFDADRW